MMEKKHPSRFGNTAAMLAMHRKRLAVAWLVAAMALSSGGTSALGLRSWPVRRQEGGSAASRKGCQALVAASPPMLLATIGPVAPGAPEPNMIQVQMGKMGDYVKEGWQRCKLGFTGLWDNWGKVREIRKREKEGVAISIHDFMTLQRDRADSTKLLHMLAVYALSPNLLPYYIIFYNRALPSTFNLPKDLEAHARQLKGSRSAGLHTMLMEMEKGCMNEKDERQANTAKEQKQVAKKILESPNWLSAVQALGPGLVYNATALKKGQRRKADLGGVPPAVIKGANMAVGAPLNFLPAFILKFQVKSAIFNIAAQDEFISKAGPEKSLASLGRQELLDLCMDRCVGDPSQTTEQLRAAALGWVRETEVLNSTIKEADPANGILVCPYRTRLALLGLHAVESARGIEGHGDLAKAVYLGGKSLKLGY